MDYKNIPLNTTPSPEDVRDFPVASLVATINVFPSSYNISYGHDIKDQGMVGSCVPHSLAYCREIVEESQSGKYRQFSPGYVYANRDLTDYQNDGMYPRQALQCLLDHGIVPQNKFPYNEPYSDLKPKFDAIKNSLAIDADPYRISAYCKLNTEADIKNALMQLGPVTACFPIYTSFYKTTKAVPMPGKSETIQGYHEMTIVGWNNDNTWRVLNSWGPGWADKGYCNVSFKYPIQEAWSMTDNIKPNPDKLTHAYWRVHVGNFPNRNDAIGCQKLLASKGYNGFITSLDGTYRVQLGAFIDKPRADALQAKLLKLNIEAKVLNY